jgi:hypothetical protein
MTSFSTCVTISAHVCAGIRLSVLSGRNINKKGERKKMMFSFMVKQQYRYAWKAKTRERIEKVFVLLTIITSPYFIRCTLSVSSYGIAIRIKQLARQRSTEVYFH